MKEFKNKILLLTGGTGSFGSTVLHHFIDSELKEIRIFSRDEKKQEDLRLKYNSDKVKFILGDVRDRRSIDQAMAGVDFVFHAAALKQVPSCEFFPMEAVKTNVIGTENVLISAVKHSVSSIVCLSTDKAVYPINAMGTSKGMMEKVITAFSRNCGNTRISITRYGNVIASRGSVIPLFMEQIQTDKPITITDPDMTRFMMTLDQSVELVLHAFKHGNNGEIFVQKAPAATVKDLASAVIKLMGRESHVIKYIGTRHGEKSHETLLSVEEMARTIDMGKYYKVVGDNRDLNYNKFTVDGVSQAQKENVEYNSNNTKRLDIQEIINLLKVAGV